MLHVSCCLFDCLILDKRLTGNPDGCVCLACFQKVSPFGNVWESLNVLAVYRKNV